MVAALGNGRGDSDRYRRRLSDMSRSPAKITQAEIVKAIKAADRLGKLCEVEIKRDGSTVLRFITQSTGVVPTAPKHVHSEVDWDDVQA